LRAVGIRYILGLLSLPVLGQGLTVPSDSFIGPAVRTTLTTLIGLANGDERMSVMDVYVDGGMK
jgi:hypothetical protein